MLSPFQPFPCPNRAWTVSQSDVLKPITNTDVVDNPKLDGVFYFDSKTRDEDKDKTGMALTICALVGLVLAAITWVSGIWRAVIKASSGTKRRHSFTLYLFTLFGLASCVGFILAADYVVSIVTGNKIGRPYSAKLCSGPTLCFNLYLFLLFEQWAGSICSC